MSGWRMTGTHCNWCWEMCVCPPFRRWVWFTKLTYFQREVFEQKAEEKSLYLHPERNQNDLPSTETDPITGILSLFVHVLNLFSHVRLFVTPWTTARQAPLSMGFSRQEYWSGLPCPPPGDLPDPGIESASLMFTSLAGMFFTSSAIWEAPVSLWKWKVSESESHSVVSDSLQPHGLYNPCNSSGQNTWVGSLPLLQGIFATQGSNPGLPHGVGLTSWTTREAQEYWSG